MITITREEVQKLCRAVERWHQALRDEEEHLFVSATRRDAYELACETLRRAILDSPLPAAHCLGNPGVLVVDQVGSPRLPCGMRALAVCAVSRQECVEVELRLTPAEVTLYAWATDGLGGLQEYEIGRWSRHQEGE